MNTLDVSDKARELMLSQFLMSLLLRGQFSFKQICQCLVRAKKVLDIEKERAYREEYKNEFLN